jgi:hypothetical protein
MRNENNAGVDLDKLEALARAATPQNFDSAQIKKEGGWSECPTCEGDGTISLGTDYCNYDGAALGVQFYGIGDEHVNAEAYYRAANPATILALINLARRARASQISKDAGAWKWVPIEPTMEMRHACHAEYHRSGATYDSLCRAIIAAAPVHATAAPSAELRTIIERIRDGAQQWPGGWSGTVQQCEKALALLSAGAAAKTEQAPMKRAGWFVHEGGAWVATSSDDPRATVLYRGEASASAAGAGSEQQLFEADCAAHGKALSRYSDGSYTAEPRARWEGWQARATLASAAGAGSEQPITTAKEFFAEARRLSCKLPADICALLARADEAPASVAGVGSEQEGVKQWYDRLTEEKRMHDDLAVQDSMLAEINDLRAALARAPLPEQDDDARDAALTQAARDVLGERRRQIEVEGWTPEHDDAHGDGQMAVAAGYYALACGWPKERDIGHGQVPVYWPWAREWWKPRNKRTNLLRAAALILADIERIDRAAMSASRLDDKAAEHDHSEGGHHD